MRIKLLVLFGVLLLSSKSFSQSFFKKATKTAYGMYSRHFSTNYVLDSGTRNLVSRKMNTSLEGGLLLDYPIHKNFSMRTGIFGHLHFLTEPLGYKTTGNYPAELAGHYNEKYKNKYSVGAEYTERFSISIPIKAALKVCKGATYDWNIAAGPVIAFYSPAREEEVNFFFSTSNYSPSPSDIQQFHIERKFRKNAIDNFLQLSVPQIEWQAEIETVRKFKRTGGIALGLKVSLGTTKLERADFVTWPQFPEFRSKGHYSLNRSYVGIYAGYRFGSNDATTKKSSIVKL